MGASRSARARARRTRTIATTNGATIQKATTTSTTHAVHAGGPLHVTSPATNVPSACSMVACAHARPAVNVPKPITTRPAAGPKGNTSVASSFSLVVQRRDVHATMTPAIHPTKGMNDPAVSSTAAVTSVPMPGLR